MSTGYYYCTYLTVYIYIFYGFETTREREILLGSFGNEKVIEINRTPTFFFYLREVYRK